MSKRYYLLLSAIIYIGINTRAQSDGCTGVPALTVNSSCVNTAYTIDGSFSDGGLVNASCATFNDRDDGWFSFVATAADITIQETGNRRHLISVWDACGGGTELGCNQQTSGVQAEIQLTGLTVGNTYYIQIHRRSGNNTSTMTGDICVFESPVCVPAAEDCQGGTTVCSSSSFTGNSNGSGCVVDLDASNDGCMFGENESSWYYFSAATDGVYEFTIVTDVDYDFAVWGPLASVSCPPVGAPLRCSYAAGSGDTGLQTGAGDNSEGAAGNSFVESISATAGEQYILVIDNYTADGSGFDLNWTLSGGGSLDCTPLPVELTNFMGYVRTESNELHFETKSEINSDFFAIQRSYDGQNFETIGKINGVGSSSQTRSYMYDDYDVRGGLTYYRIESFDTDGTSDYSHVITLERASDEIECFPNPTKGELKFLFKENHIGNMTITYQNILGQTLQEEVLADGSLKEYQSELLINEKAGIYFLTISDQFGNQLLKQKIVKH